MTTLPTDAELGDVTKLPSEMKPRMLAFRQFVEDLLGTDSATPSVALGKLKALRNERLAKTAAYAVANADKGKTIACASTPWALTFGTATGYDTDFICMVLNESTSRALRVVVTGGTDFWLYPGQTATVYRQSSAWRVVRPQRWKLAANTTLYADGTNGNDSNDGLAAGAGNAFLTPQKAVDLIESEIDTAGFSVTVQLANGTYASGVALKDIVGGGNAILLGDEGNLDNVFFDVTGNHAVRREYGNGIWHVRGLKLRAATAGFCLGALGPTTIKFQNCKFGNSGWGGRLGTNLRGIIQATGDFTIYESGASWINAAFGGVIDVAGRTATLVSAPVFSGAGVLCTRGSIVEVYGMTFTGTATGPRYSVSGNSTINTGGGGASYLPGDSAGSADTGGQYF